MTAAREGNFRKRTAAVLPDAAGMMKIRVSDWGESNRKRVSELRKLGLISLLVGTVLLVSCAKPDEPQVEPYADYIGQSRKTVFQGLGLTDKNAREERPSSWTLDKTVSLAGADFTVHLNFDEKADTLYGFFYFRAAENFTEKDYDTGKALAQELTKKYGEPTTYPGLPNRISDLTDYAQLPRDQNADYLERWSVPGHDNLTVELRLTTTEAGNLLMKLEYRIIVEHKQ